MLEGLVELMAAAQPNDGLSLVLQSHLMLEECFNFLIENSLKHPEHLDLDRLNFYTKVHICAAMGCISSDLLPAIKVLNKLRNSFAHDSNYTLEQSDVESIWNALPEGSRIGDIETVRSSTTKANMICVLAGIVAPVQTSVHAIKYPDKFAVKRRATILTARASE